MPELGDSAGKPSDGWTGVALAANCASIRISKSPVSHLTLAYEVSIWRKSDETCSFCRLLHRPRFDFCAGPEQGFREIGYDRPAICRFRRTNRHGGGQPWTIGRNRKLFAASKRLWSDAG